MHALVNVYEKEREYGREWMSEALCGCVYEFLWVVVNSSIYLLLYLELYQTYYLIHLFCLDLIFITYTPLFY